MNAVPVDALTWRAERVIILELLRDDHDERWTLAELVSRVVNDELTPRAVRDALARLEAEGVVVVFGGYVLASRCARRIDDVGLVGV